MIYITSVIALFVVISIYFFFRAENLQRELLLAKRTSNNVNKEKKALLDTMMLVAKRNDESVKYRLKRIQKEVKDQQASDKEQRLKIITPLINNYSAIFLGCLKGKGQLGAITKKCYENNKMNSFQEFTKFIAKGEPSIRRMWASNNLQGFIALTEALLIEQEESVASKPVVVDIKKVSNSR
jgi:hypothetical protein